jgi:endonuclease III
MNPDTIQKIFELFKNHDPDPRTELNYQTLFELLVAVILSAQATDKNVNKVTAFLFLKANTPAAILVLGLDGLMAEIKSLNYYRTKAKHLIETAQILVSQYQGQVPNHRAALESFPGVGRKTANVILNTGFGESTIAVDTHIFRVANRTGLASGKTPMAVEKQLQACIPASYQREAHHWLVLHGRYVCLARKPKCKVCLINKYCEYTEKVL